RRKCDSCLITRQYICVITDKITGFFPFWGQNSLLLPNSLCLFHTLSLFHHKDVDRWCVCVCVCWCVCVCVCECCNELSITRGASACEFCIWCKCVQTCGNWVLYQLQD